MRIRFTLDITRTPRAEDIEPQPEGSFSQAELSPQDQRDFADEGAYESDDKRAGFHANP